MESRTFKGETGHESQTGEELQVLLALWAHLQHACAYNSMGKKKPSTKAEPKTL